MSFSQNSLVRKNNAIATKEYVEAILSDSISNFLYDTLATKGYADTIFSEDGEYAGINPLVLYDYGMLVDEIDTFAVVHIELIKIANKVFIERNYYRNLTDSLVSIDIVKEGKIKDMEKEMESIKEEKDRHINIAKLEKDEADDCEGKYNKLARKYKRAKLGNKIFGTTTIIGIVAVVILLLL